MSSSELPPLRPLAGSTDLILEREPDVHLEFPKADPEPPEPEPDARRKLPWETCAGEAGTVADRLKSFCREAELVYSAIVEKTGEIHFSVCTVGSLPHNEDQIGSLVSRLSATANELGAQVGERHPQGLHLQGTRWSYSLDPISNELFLFSIYPARALPAIVRAGAQKAIADLKPVLDPEKTED